MTLFEVKSLPAGALDAAARFHTEALPRIRAAIDALPGGAEPGHLTILFPPAPYDHRGWRLAAVQDLARAAAPRRVNGIVAEGRKTVAETQAYLEAAPGVTGQLLTVDGKSGRTR